MSSKYKLLYSTNALTYKTRTRLIHTEVTLKVYAYPAVTTQNLTYLRVLIVSLQMRPPIDQFCHEAVTHFDLKIWQSLYNTIENSTSSCRAG